MMPEDKIWILIARKMTNEASGEDLLELENLAKADGEVAECLELFSTCWRQKSQGSIESTQLAFEKIFKKISEEKR
jgi:hypothetical protein